MIGFPFFALPTEAGLLFFPFLSFCQSSSILPTILRSPHRSNNSRRSVATRGHRAKLFWVLGRDFVRFNTVDIESFELFYFFLPLTACSVSRSKLRECLRKRSLQWVTVGF